jgi:hypothetical protein
MVTFANERSRVVVVDTTDTGAHIATTSSATGPGVTTNHSAANSSAKPSRTLVVDGRAAVAEDCARSRHEAIERIIANHYDMISLHTTAGGLDEYDLVGYLANVWPTYLEHLTIRTITHEGVTHEWNHQRACFEALPTRRTRGVSREPQTRHGALSRMASDTVWTPNRNHAATLFPSSVPERTRDDARQ